jgi:hypothetical protein
MNEKETRDKAIEILEEISDMCMEEYKTYKQLEEVVKVMPLKEVEKMVKDLTKVMEEIKHE